MSTRASRISPLEPEEEPLESKRFDLNSFAKKNGTLISVLSLALGVGLVLALSLWSLKAITDLNTRLSVQGEKSLAPTAVVAAPPADGRNNASILGLPETTAQTPIPAVTFPAPVETGHFPGEVTGPAIVEWWNGGSSCGIFALPEGENFSYDQNGSWWRFSSEEDLEDRYATHRSEYLVKGVGNEGRP